MLPTIVCGLVVILLWTFAARRLLDWHVSGPVVMVVGGVAVALASDDALWDHLDTGIAERLVELILSVMLFVDAIEVRGGFLAGERRIAVRLLLVALPLSLVTAFTLGLFLLGLVLGGRVRRDAHRHRHQARRTVRRRGPRRDHHDDHVVRHLAR